MALTLSAAQFAGAAEADSLSIHDRLDSAVVTVSRAGDKTPVTFTMVGKDELRQANPINSLPMILSLQPSVVTYNEGGTGLGNSNMTIRGSKGSQINVTLNGITLNDAESQEVFWVNIPSLSSLISSVQLQRGLGTSANGSGAFGASVNMSTASVSQNPFASVDVSAGSWNTFETTVAAGTGLTKSGLYFNIAFSRGYTDGYIDNAKVRSKSAFGVLGWMRGNNSIRFTWLMGDQRSGITWDGIDLDMYHTDRRHNDAGLYWDEYGGEHRYDNQTDNYTQNHFQLNYTRQFGDRLTWTTTLNYTRGDGYDEYYKEDKEIADYGFPSSMTGTDGNAFSESDMIYDKKMGNDFYVINSDVRYKSSSLVLTGGVNLSRYDGDHWGKMLWVKNLGDDYDYSSFNKADSWYRNDATKKEATVFGRAEWSPNDLITAFADLQWRLVSLEMEGPDDDKVAVDYDNDWSFFNPRAGLTFNFAEGHKAYASVALGHREPGRSDIKENVKGDDISPIKPERMIDGELGYQFTADNLSLSANLYMMEYWDMLLETGKLSTSGYAIKENVPRSWRRGIELAASWAPASWLRLNANGTFSDNKIHDYVKYIGVDDGELGETVPVEYGTTTMLMSPSVTAMGKATVSPWKNSSRSLKSTTFSMDVKYVGRQYIDNTERASRKIPAYVVSNFSVSHEFALGGGHLGLTGYVNNIFNNHYYAAGWGWDSYSKSSGEYYGGIGVYPAAIVNFMFKVSYRF
jgi:iron complex outermembrane receptor protein